MDWVPDVCFGEDASTKRAGGAAENFSFISKVGLNLLNQSDESKGSKKLSIKRKRKKADRDRTICYLCWLNQDNFLMRLPWADRRLAVRLSIKFRSFELSPFALAKRLLQRFFLYNASQGLIKKLEQLV